MHLNTRCPPQGDMTEIELLTKLGFTKGESKVYTTLLEFEELTIGPLARNAKVTPSKVYIIIEKLTEKGLVSTILKDGTKTFRALDPNSLLNLLEERRDEIETQKNQVKELIPKILKKRKIKTQEFAKTYEGYEGLKSLYEEAIRTLEKLNEDFTGFTLSDEYQYEQAREFFKIYDRKRSKAGINLRLIAEISQKKYLDEFQGEGITYHFTKQSLPLGTIIFGDTVATVIWGKTPKAFAIHSKEHAKKYKQFFEDLWDKSKS